MTFERFEQSLEQDAPPDDLSHALQALWHDRRGDWDAAHAVAQEIDDETGAWVHGYLHRKEGDIGNARYWYQRARVAVATGPLDAEWRAIVEALLVRLR